MDFVQGKSIVDNIFMAQELMHYVEESGQDLTLLLLDFEKAYDCKSWNFMRVVLEKQGFHKDFIERIMDLYNP